MHYAIVTETYPPEVNGVALTVQSLEQGLRARGHEVDLLRPRQANDVPEAALPHETLLRGSPIPRYPSMRFGHPAPRLLARTWRQRRPDALYIATEGPLGYSALRTARSLGIPFVTGFHTRFDSYMEDYGVPFLRPLAVRWMRHMHNASDATLVPTCELVDQLMAQGFDGIAHLPRAVDSYRFSPAKRSAALRAEWGADENTLVVLYLGRVAAEKNLSLCVRTFREIQTLRPDAKFVWIGEGPELGNIQRENPDFIIRGLRLGEDLAHHVASADLFPFPSHSETFGNVTIEAMASGVATVAFRYGAAREHLRDGVDGASISGRDEGAFMDACLRIATDDALRRRMGQNARHAVERLLPENVARDLDDILQRIIRGRSVNHGHAAVA